MRRIYLILAQFFLFFLFCFETQAQVSEVYKFVKRIDLPGNSGYDYMNIDPVNNKLYVSHGTSVNVIDLKTDKVVGEISDMKGVHGIAIDNELGRGFISDGRANSIVAFDLKTYSKLATIPVTGIGPDAILYDSFSKRVYSFNGHGKSISVVDAFSFKQVDSILLGGGPEFAVSDGKGKIYNNNEDLNLLKVIDTKSNKVIDSFPLSPCETPTGLGADLKHGRLFTGCRKNKGMSVVDINSGKVITTVDIGSGVDAVWYDPKTAYVFCSCGDATTTIIKQITPDQYKVVQTLKTEPRAKTMALDLKTHKIYLSAPSFDPDTKKPLPNSFHVLVYSMN